MVLGGGTGGPVEILLGVWLARLRACERDGERWSEGGGGVMGLVIAIVSGAATFDDR